MSKFKDVQELLKLCQENWKELGNLEQVGLTFLTPTMIREEIARQIEEIQRAFPVFQEILPNERYIILGKSSGEETGKMAYVSGETLLLFTLTFPELRYHKKSRIKSSIIREIEVFEDHYYFECRKVVDALEHYREKLSGCRLLKDVSFVVLKRLAEELQKKNKTYIKLLREGGVSEKEEELYKNLILLNVQSLIKVTEEARRRLEKENKQN